MTVGWVAEIPQPEENVRFMVIEDDQVHTGGAYLFEQASLADGPAFDTWYECRERMVMASPRAREEQRAPWSGFDIFAPRSDPSQTR